MDQSLRDQSRSLLKRVTKQCMTGQAYGFMSSSVYDTAWLSMLHKPGNSEKWIFPECFEFILQNQLPSGAWESYASETDGILNTAAALLALKAHLRECPGNQDWVLRSKKAESTLRLMLDSWDVGNTDQVGFELLVIKHLSLLEDEGISFECLALDVLRDLHNSKFSKVPITHIYEEPSTLYHSLEALIDHVDFDRLKCHKEDNGSMFNSPASTAAYLMHSSAWDDKAESYLEQVVAHGTGKKDGGVPCAWPTTIFEVTWVVTTLAEIGFPMASEHELGTISIFLEQALASRGGLVGFAPSILPDADDTAKAMIALHHLGKPTKALPLLTAFNGDDHFRTYKGERNASFSANCNILMCLLTLEDWVAHGAEIAKAISFLCVQVFSGKVKEKWHTHDLYWIMLLSQAFVLLYRRAQDRDRQLLDELFVKEPQLRQQIPMTSLQVLFATLSSQDSNGSWSNICELTAYAVIALCSMLQLPWIHQLQDERIITAIHKGKSFLDTHRGQWDEGHHLWVEKVTYASNTLSEAYCLVAALVPVTLYPPQHHPAFLLPTEVTEGVKRAMNLINKTPLFSRTRPEILQGARLLAAYALCYLQHQRMDIFPQLKNGKVDQKYQVFTPVIWSACSAKRRNAVDLSTLCDMMSFSMVIYQVDEYMEGSIQKDFGRHLPLVRGLVRQLCSSHRAGLRDGKGHADDFQGSTADGLASGAYATLEDIRSTLNRFIEYVVHHPAVLSSPQGVQNTLSYELETFLVAHIAQAEDNQRFALQGATTTSAEGNPTPQSTPREYQNPGKSFYNWVRGTSANHTSCPFAFIFFNCLVSKSFPSIYRTAKSAYLAEDLCRHLASLCRMYNDYGSVARDKDEGNLNSVNFPEFHRGVSRKVRQGLDDGNSIKDQLMWIADYERDGLNRATRALEQELCEDKFMDALRVFIDVTDLYGQTYVQRDLTSRTM
ncbi:Ent-kaurene synthase [Hypoxylon sp. FL1150]|nr:Ent-kaurene synthase [Hypoxylon sp. FL1150]